jgi:hypothetical protein
MVRVPRRVLQRLLSEQPTPERCVEAYHLQRTRFERIAERKLRQHQLTEDGKSRSAGATCARPRRPLTGNDTSSAAYGDRAFVDGQLTDQVRRETRAACPSPPHR